MSEANGPHYGQHFQGCVSCYAHVDAARTQFDALLVGAPAAGGPIRHRARPLTRRARLARLLHHLADRIRP